MPQVETTNIIIGLRRKGWSDTEINDFMMLGSKVFAPNL